MYIKHRNQASTDYTSTLPFGRQTQNAQVYLSPSSGWAQAPPTRIPLLLLPPSIPCPSPPPPPDSVSRCVCWDSVVRASARVDEVKWGCVLSFCRAESNVFGTSTGGISSPLKPSLVLLFSSSDLPVGKLTCSLCFLKFVYDIPSRSVLINAVVKGTT